MLSIELVYDARLFHREMLRYEHYEMEYELHERAMTGTFQPGEAKMQRIVTSFSRYKHYFKE